MCAYGLSDPVSGLFMRKAMHCVHNFPKGIAESMFKKCSKNREHQTIIGSSPGYGSRAIISQAYPQVLCEDVARVLRRAIQSREPEDDIGLPSMSKTNSDVPQQKNITFHTDALRPTTNDVKSLEKDQVASFIGRGGI